MCIQRNVQWHILAPPAVACDIILVRRSAHPAGAFYIMENTIFHYIKKTAYPNQISDPENLCIYYTQSLLISLLSAFSTQIPIKFHLV